MTNTRDLKWLVNRRSKIQSFLLRLHKHLDKSDQQKEASKLLVIHLLIGAGFSLWRSVFLAENDRTLDKTNEHAKEFLRLLIKDNIVNYPQDYNARAWTSGYYINNAYFRLRLAYERLPLINTPLKKTVTTFLDEQKGAADVYEAIEAWDNAYKAALEILKNIE